jgi:alanine racemase
VETDLDAVRHNARVLRDIAGARLMAVLKADAYGHGAALTARAAMEGGAAWLALATLEEAAALRACGIEAPILLLGYVAPEQMRAAVALRLAVSVGDWGAARALSDAAAAVGTVAAAHLAVDTGMSRLGLFPAEAPALLQRAKELPALRFEGIYTHLSTADGEWAASEREAQNAACRAEDSQSSVLSPQSSALSPQHSALSTQSSVLSPQPSALSPQSSALSPQSSALSTQSSALAYAHLQLDRFDALLAELEGAALRPPLAHAANSAALLRLPRAARYQLARPGLALYGLPPFSPHDAPDAARRAAMRALRPALAWRTRLARVAELPAGTPVSYAAAYVTPGHRRIATLPVGYADGLRRSPPWRAVLVRGRRAPIVGRICMDYAMCDVTHIPGAAQGDEATLLGAQGDEHICAAEAAGWLGTSVYELLTSIGGRVPRLARVNAGVL